MAGLVGSSPWRSSEIFGLSRPSWKLRLCTSTQKCCSRAGFRKPLVVRCSDASSDAPKSKPRRRKKAGESLSSPNEEEAPAPKVRRQSRASAASAPGDLNEPSFEKPKKKRAAPKRKVVEVTAAEVEFVDGSGVVKAGAKTKRKSRRDRKDRWTLMEEEKLKVIEGKSMADVEVLYESEDEEEDDDGTEVQGASEDEEKQDGDVVDMKFPDKECYALVSSYKPRKISPDERPPLTNDELWWNWKNRRPDEHVWSEFQKRPGLPDITMAAMAALTGQIKLFGDTPTVTETHIYRARKFVFKEERLAAEAKRRDEIGAMAYYQEWVKAWGKDTSNEAVQKHFEETGEDVAQQLMNMLACQTQREYRQMMGTDVRIRRDPLVMRATREMKRSVFGGDPVYPTINYRKKPDDVPDYRGPNFHQPRPNMIEHLIRGGRMKTRAEHNRIMALQQQRLEAAAVRAEEDEAVVEEMAAAIDIGDKEIEDEDDEEEEDVDASFKEEIISVPTEKLIELAQEDEEDEEDTI